MKQWIKTTDHLPSNSRHVLYWDENLQLLCYGYYCLGECQWYTDDHYKDENKITHWMELPKGPTS